MKAVWNGTVLADSERTVEQAGYRYFPRGDVRMELLRPAAKSESDLRCPHGVQFYDVSDGDAASARAAWSYERPQPAYAAIDHWIGFWRDVELAD